MEVVPIKNAARLRQRIERQGWPGEDLAGKDGAEAAWLIAQHATGEPDFQRRALKLLPRCGVEGRVSDWYAACLEDRIAMYEGRPQRYGAQWMDDPQDGRTGPGLWLSPVV